MKLRALAVLLPALAHCASLKAGEPPLAIDIAVPVAGGERRIVYGDGTHFFSVVISNISGRTQRIWQDSCSWGYQGLKFEITDAQGRKSVAQKRNHPWRANAPFWLSLNPHKKLAFDVHFADTSIWGGWNGFPWPDQRAQTVTMRAVFEFAPDKYSREFGVWTGRIVSKTKKFVFHR